MRVEGQQDTARESRLLETILDHTPTLIAFLDTHFVILRVNRAYAAAEGHDPSYYVGKSHFDIFPNPENEQIFRRVIQTLQPQSVHAQRFEYPGRPERGVSYWDWTVQPILDPDGAATELVLSVREVTDWVLAQEALRESEASFRQVAEGVDEGLWLAELGSGERRGRVLYANPAFAQILGLSAEAAHDFGAWFERVHPQDRLRVQARMREFGSGQKERYNLEYRIVRPDGSTGWIWVQSHRISVERARLSRFVVLVRDITERKQGEKRLLRVRGRLARRVRELTSIHHASRRLRDLRTPHSLAQALIGVLEDTLQYEHGAVLLLDQATGDLVPIALGRSEGSAEALEADRAHVASHRPMIGKGITGWVAQNGQSVRLGDVRLDPRYYALREGIRSELCVPLRLGDRVLGVVNVESRRPDAYTSADQRLLETVAVHMAVALENARLYDRELRQAQMLEHKVAERTTALSEAVRRLQEEGTRRARAEADLDRSHRAVSALNRVSTRLHARLDLQAALDALAASLEPDDLVALALMLDEASGSLLVHPVSVAPQGHAQHEQARDLPPEGLCLPADSWPFCEVIGTERPLHVPELRPFARFYFPGMPDQQVEALARRLRINLDRPSVCAPLAAGGKVVGVLVIQGAELLEQDLPACSLLANQLASSLERLGLGRKSAEVEILREVNRLRSELIGNVSHEIRTPLGLIDVLCTSLLAGDIAFDAETQRDFLAGIKDATDKLAAIVENLLQLSRTESGRLVADRQPGDLAELAAGAIRRINAEGSRHHLILRLPEEGCPARVDAAQISLVLGNLLSNAIRYSPDGGDVVVAIERSGDGWQLSVSDQGIGIPEDEQQRIFERFHRVDSPTGRKVGGTGLGLSVCRSLVEAHGGKIWVVSRPGVGSTFFVSLPADAPTPQSPGGES